MAFLYPPMILCLWAANNVQMYVFLLYFYVCQWAPSEFLLPCVIMKCLSVSFMPKDRNILSAENIKEQEAAYSWHYSVSQASCHLISHHLSTCLLQPIDYEGFQLFMTTYLENDIPEELCKHLFTSFKSKNGGGSSPDTSRSGAGMLGKYSF